MFFINLFYTFAKEFVSDLNNQTLFNSVFLLGQFSTCLDSVQIYYFDYHPQPFLLSLSLSHYDNPTIKNFSIQSHCILAMKCPLIWQNIF